MFAYLGVDVAKATFDVALVSQAGKLRHKQYANRSEGFVALTAWLAKQEITQVHACLEATGPYSSGLADYLHETGHKVSVVNPLRIQAFAKSQLSRNKTDKADAALIARFCQSQQPELWTPPPPHLRELQALMRHLEALQETRQQQSNRLEMQSVTTVQTSLLTLLAYLDAEIGRVQEHIRDHIQSHPDLQQQQKLPTSIPGIGDLTAAKLLAEVERLCSYKSARQAAAYAGLTPRQHQSGSSVRGQTRLSKAGNARVRKALYFPAVVAMRFNPIIRDLCQRLRERHKNSMVIVGAAMRKLLHLAYGVLKTGRPFDPQYALTP
jgi:transposase